MKLGINGATTMPYSLEEDIRAAAQAGFESIEIWYGKLQEYLKKKPIEELKELIQDSRLEIATLCPTFIRAFAKVEESLQEFQKAVELAGQLGCKTLLACPDTPPAGTSKQEAIRQFSKIVSQAVEIADRGGIRIALEPLGRHPLLDGPAAALDVLLQVRRENLGLMMDTFHYYKSDVTLDEIQQIPIDKLYILHINDCEDLPKNELKDKDRLYPTLGVIPAVEMLKPIIQKGYQGSFSVEVFRPAYWETPIDEINRTSYETGRKLLSILKEA